MWDLTIQTAHDFYVVTTGAGILVHNCEGETSSYTDATQGNSIRNISTNVSADEFGQNLVDSGWSSSPASNGNATVYTRSDGARYSVYRGTSTGEMSAEFTPAGSTQSTLKIRFGG